MKIFLLLMLIASCSAYDIFSGLLLTVKDCFPLLESGECNTSMSKAFETQTKGYLNTPDTQFSLFTPTNPDKAEQLHKCGGKLPKDSAFNTSCPTVVVTHGYLEGVCRVGWMRQIKEQLQVRGDYNVILVDWTWCSTIDLAASAVCTYAVGEQTAFVINSIMDQKNVKAESFDIIGHSFGVNVASVAGKNIKKPYKLGRITALDPAVTPFRYYPKRRRLTRSDAKFVQLIHTNGGKCFSAIFFGTEKQWGHQDFYINGGRFQFNCYEKIFEYIFTFDLLSALGSLVPSICFHQQSTVYFVATINPGNSTYIGHRCDSYEDFKTGKCSSCGENRERCATWGFDAEPIPGPERQRYYAETDFFCPYSDASAQFFEPHNNKSCNV